ncbi:hypothetical protein NE237_019824 [Protea cynaroides]|uniref:Uncharacterized protein n=1 Tax=Protea cynaroides TaxID=273540 RepID=A0A9Q0K126_9MAGN|nr:hypothetical protein NE237_019824 [Protea cynaroides]
MTTHPSKPSLGGEGDPLGLGAMASSQKSLLIFSLLLLFTSLFLLPLPSSATLDLCSPNAIYQLGDSISDTGNLIRESTSPAASAFAHLPYGVSFFRQQSTGRCSNGLLMIDYLALSLRLPLLNPFLEKDADFTRGVNFAVAGSTALDSSFLAENDISSPVTNSSLFVQLDWLKSHLNSICYTEKGALLYTGGDVNKSGELGKMFDIVVVDPSSNAATPAPPPPSRPCHHLIFQIYNNSMEIRESVTCNDNKDAEIE